jgi:hypothetical protein
LSTVLNIENKEHLNIGKNTISPNILWNMAVGQLSRTKEMLLPHMSGKFNSRFITSISILFVKWEVIGRTTIIMVKTPTNVNATSDTKLSRAAYIFVLNYCIKTIILIVNLARAFFTKTHKKKEGVVIVFL